MHYKIILCWFGVNGDLCRFSIGGHGMAKKMENLNDIQMPGLVLKAKLKELGMTQRVLASQLAIQTSHLSEIIRGKRSLTEQYANKLAMVFKEPASYWLHLQAEYDFKEKTADKDGAAEKDAQITLSQYNELYDMKEIFKRTGMQKASLLEKLEFCRTVLNFGSFAVQKQASQGYYHRSEKTGLDLRMISTWSVLAMHDASLKPTPVGIFDKQKCDELSLKLSSIFNENYCTLNRVESTLSEYGIKFCVVQKVNHASIDGFSFYQNGIPTIVVTKRFDRIDNLAFAVLHEIGHLKKHLSPDGIGNVNLVNPDAEGIAKEEREANEYASNALIPDSLWKEAQECQFSVNPFAIQKGFTRWAREKQLNKWIVLGRVSHETGIYMFKSDDSRKIL